MPETVPIDPWLRHLERYVPIARKGLDPEGVHQMRVAIERLRVWSNLARRPGLSDDLRWLRHRLAAVRDLDVQLEEEPPPEIAASLRLRRARAQRDLRATLDGRRFDELLAALRRLPPVASGRVQKKLPKLARDVRVRVKAARRDEYDLDSLHAVRRAVRRLRFALEWLGVDAADLVELQDALGAACDAHIRLRALRGDHAEANNDERYRTRLKHRRRRAKRDAISALRHVRRRVEAALRAVTA